MNKEQAKSILKKVVNPDVKEAIETLIPELTESEDERIIKTLQEYVKNRNWPLNGPTQDEVLAWLENQKEASKAIEAVDRIDKYIDEHLANAHDMKDSNPDKKYYRGWDDALGAMAGILQDVYSGEKQKEHIEKEYVFRPLPGTGIILAAEQAIRRANEGDRLVLAFNGAYIPVRKGCNANEIVDIYDGIIEKQKETGIRWFKSDNVKNPDKPYIDKAGRFYTTDGRMCHASEIEKQKEQIPYIDFVIKPHKGDDNNPYDMPVSEAQEYAINRGFGIPFNDGEVYVDERYMTQTIGNILRWADEHPKEQKPVKSIFPPGLGEVHFNPISVVEQKSAEKHDLVTQLKEHLANTPKEQLDAEWEALEKWNDVGPTVEEYLCGIKPSECEDCAMHLSGNCIHPNGKCEKVKSKPEWSEEDETCIRNLESIIYYDKKLSNDTRVILGEFLNNLRKRLWKPSEEQMEALKRASTNEYLSAKQFDILVSLCEQLQRLM